MKSIHIAAVAVIGVLLVVTVAIAQRFVGDDSTTADADTSVAISSDPIRSFTPDLDAQGKAQAEQLLTALDEMRDRTTQASEGIVVTVRDEEPLEIWEVQDDTCIMIDTLRRATIEVWNSAEPRVVRAYELPTTADHARDGSCVATTTVTGHDVPSVEFNLVIGGRTTSARDIEHVSPNMITIVQ